MATTNNAVQNGVEWARELGQKYTSGIAHQFILHFNVADYAHGLATVEEYLLAMLSSRDMVISYDIASGIQFKGPKGAEQRKLFIEALGLDQQAGVDSLAAAMGLQTVAPQQPQGEIELPRNPAKALPLLERALHLREVQKNGDVTHPRVAVIINWAEQLAPAADAAMMSPADRLAMVTLARWATDPQIIVNQGIVILVTRNLTDLAEPLRASTSRIEAIAVTLPDESARLVWIDNYVASKQSDRKEGIEAIATDAVIQAGEHPESAQGQKLLRKARKDAAKIVPELKMEIDVQTMARMTAILSLIHIEDIFLRAMHEGRPVDQQLVKDRKQAIISREFADVLEVMEPRFGLDMIAGHEPVKVFMKEYVIGALQRGDVARAPLGVLLMGPAGTGKTALVEAVAYECGFNAINLNLAKILQGLVGASERNLEKALLAIEALAPCIVFTDEIDQKLGQRGGYQGDSGVSSRLFGRVMEFMSDTAHRGRIVWLAATNRPDLLDAAFKRPGRFDAKIPLLLPSSDEERVQIFYVMLLKYGLKTDPEDTRSSEEVKMNQAAKATDGYTGAEIEAIVIKANQIAGRNGRAEGIVHPDDILKACKLIAPSTRDIQFMTALALAEVTDLELVPEAYRSQAANKEVLHQQVEALTPARRTAREL